MRPVNTTLLNAVDANANQSAIVPNEFLMAISVQAVAAGGGPPAGVLKLQASNDPPSFQAAQNWSDISGASVNITGVGVFLIPKTEVCYRWIKVVYTKSGGAGTLTVNLEGWGV
jgi:hypothetical protein